MSSAFVISRPGAEKGWAINFDGHMPSGHAIDATNTTITSTYPGLSFANKAATIGDRGLSFDATCAADTANNTKKISAEIVIDARSTAGWRAIFSKAVDVFLKINIP